MKAGHAPPGPTPATELAQLLEEARRRLDQLLAEGCSAPSGAPPPCLDELYDYLLEQLVPLLHGVRLRIRPVLRRHLGREAGASAAVPAADAVLERLVERVALLRATYADDPVRARLELAPLLPRLAEHAACRLDLERRTLPVLVGALPVDVGSAAVAGLRRTADAVRAVPRTDLAVGVL
ncbi:MAG TPA: hypothetical protein VFS29_13570 [Motilibacteraceae bacterium]|nr:hypothetical protein [Motilibacteraceae bacterium]